MHAWLYTYIPQLRQKNGWLQELKKFRRVHYQRFMIIILYLFRRNSYFCMPYCKTALFLISTFCIVGCKTIMIMHINSLQEASFHMQLSLRIASDSSGSSVLLSIQLGAYSDIQPYRY